MSTPTYALRLADAAREEGSDLARSALRVVDPAGEPGASIPATRDRIEKALGSNLRPHRATEIVAHRFLMLGARWRSHQRVRVHR